MNLRELIREAIEDHEKEIRNKNFEIMGQHQDYIVNDIPDFFIQEAGIEEVLHFLAQEDGMNFQLQHMTTGVPDFSKQQPPTSDNEIERILQANRIPYSLKEVKLRLYKYFIRRLAYNTPRDRVFASPQKALDFIKTYEQKFFYEYFKPMAAIHRRK